LTRREGPLALDHELQLVAAGRRTVYPPMESIRDLEARNGACQPAERSPGRLPTSPASPSIASCPKIGLVYLIEALEREFGIWSVLGTPFPSVPLEHVKSTTNLTASRADDKVAFVVREVAEHMTAIMAVIDGFALLVSLLAFRPDPEQALFILWGSSEVVLSPLLLVKEHRLEEFDEERVLLPHGLLPVKLGRDFLNPHRNPFVGLYEVFSLRILG